ncbi:MAG: PTS transporter subunit EIIB, partial [Clostridiales bacterium]|nr:PTS transporter subunit EIIB [Clostridiales bacterium]
MASNQEIAKNVLEAVGGKDNVTNVTHCMTRLRLTLKDQGIPNDEEVKKIKGVLGVVRSGGQYQVIIGQNVPKVYAEVCSIGGFAVKAAVQENLDGPKEKLT